MASLKQRLNETVSFIKKELKVSPKIGIILGTGLSALTKKVKSQRRINYSKIPHFPSPTVKTHKGEMVFGKIGNTYVAAMEGRFHYYEGYSLEQVTYPVRVLRRLGAEVLIISNAAGGMNPQYKPGDLVVIEDHINLMGLNPLIGPNEEALGPRFPDMCQPYDRRLIGLAEKIAQEERIKIYKGVYVGVTGPNLETKAEYRFLRLIGADLVGMSTVPEVIVGVHSGFRIFGISIVTDSCLPDVLKPVDISEIIRVANEAEPSLTTLVSRMIENL